MPPHSPLQSRLVISLNRRFTLTFSHHPTSVRPIPPCMCAPCCSVHMHTIAHPPPPRRWLQASGPHHLLIRGGLLGLRVLCSEVHSKMPTIQYIATVRDKQQKDHQYEVRRGH
jgi:hypothetical protein